MEQSTRARAGRLLLCSALAFVCVALFAPSTEATNSMHRRLALGSRSFTKRVFRAAELTEQPASSSSSSQARTRASSCPNGMLFGVVTVTVDSAQKSHYEYQASCDRAGLPKKAVARGVFSDKLKVQGWDELTISTSKKFSDLQQAFAAGYLEGALTADKIWLISRFTNKKAHKDVHSFFEKQDAFLRAKINAVKMPISNNEDAWWYNVALILAQLDGVYEGYKRNADPDKVLSKAEFWLMNSDGDVMDIERMVAPGVKHKRVEDMNRAELIELVSIYGRCSVLIKWTGDDLIAGHTTWEDYAEMLRVFKHYHFNFQHASVKSKKSSHSSYPGFVTSSDDFYVLDTNIAVLETTLNILNEKLYGVVDPSATVVAWIRSIVANRMATDGKSWCDAFRKYNSGTYNDQWMIVDYNKFKPGQTALAPGTLWVLEQIPGLVEAQDLSDLLTKEKYFASYNRPYFRNINEKSMYAKFTSEHGNTFSYKDNPRAKIFEREQKQVIDIASLKKVMMFNKYQTDPFSEGCPGNSIAGRFDLPSVKPCTMTRLANGATDSKVISSSLMREQTCEAIAGPTHDDQKPFDWNDPLWKHESHEGQPDLWNFSWKRMMPTKP